MLNASKLIIKADRSSYTCTAISSVTRAMWKWGTFWSDTWFLPSPTPRHQRCPICNQLSLAPSSVLCNPRAVTVNYYSMAWCWDFEMSANAQHSQFPQDFELRVFDHLWMCKIYHLQTDWQCLNNSLLSISLGVR